MKSDAVKTGMQQAPHRSLFNALGMTEEEMRKPLVGIVSSLNNSSFITALLSTVISYVGPEGLGGLLQSD